METRLEELQPGAHVCLTDKHGPRTVLIIERVTKTQIIGGNRRFNRRTGYVVGADDLSAGRIVPMTEENERQVRVRQHARYAREAMSLAETEFRKLNPDPGVVAAHLNTAAKQAAKWHQVETGKVHP